MPTPPPRPLILASTSPYRRELLARLRLPFEVVAPEVDETPRPGESPAALAARLALAKARAVAQRHPHAVVIGSDQVADLDGEPLGKPGDHARATAQLRRMRGRTVVFQTAVAVVCMDSGFEQQDLAPVRVHFRDLDRRRDRDLPAHRAALRLRRQRPQRRPGHRAAGGDRQRRPDGPGRPAADPHLPPAARAGLRAWPTSRAHRGRWHWTAFAVRARDDQ